jgi:hypothetical protein
MGRRVGAWLVAAVVTAALVVGGVVVAGGGRDREPAMLPPLDLNGAQSTAAAAEAAAEPARVGAPAPAARPYDTGDAPTRWPSVTYRLRGSLPDLPDRARAWRLGTDADSGRMAALVAALGLRGQLKQDQAGWTVSDGRRRLRVNKLAGLPWSYGNVVVGACVGGPWPASPASGRGIQCLTTDTATAKDPKAGAAGGGTTGSGAGSPASPGSARPVVPGRLIRPLPRPVDLPSREAAERIARELAAKAGLALDGAAVQAADGYAARLVTIAPAVGGQPTHGVAWHISVGPKGRVQYASGWLATPQPADTYPLISEAEALQRLRQRSAFWPPILRPNVTEGARVKGVPCPPATRVPCTGKPLPKQTLTITGVRLGLQLAPGVAKGSRPAGVAFLLPAYLFDLEGGWTDVQSVVAVQDRYLTKPGP